MNIEKITDDFEAAYQAIAYKSAPIAAAVGMGLVYAYSIHESIGGFSGWVIGGILASGMEFAGMHTFSIAIKEKSNGWYALSALYVATHIITLIMIELLSIGSMIIVAMALIVAAILAYASRGYAKEKQDLLILEAKQEQDKEKQRIERLQAERDAIDTNHYKEEKEEEARNRKLLNKKTRSNFSPKQSEIVRDESPKQSENSLIVQFSELLPEQQKEILKGSWKDYCTKYEALHGPISKSTYYGKWRKV